MAGQPWSKEEEDALIRLAEKGYKLEEIFKSGVFSRSFAALHRKAHVLDISLGGKQGEIDQEAFRRLMGEGNGSDRKQSNSVSKA